MQTLACISFSGKRKTLCRAPNHSTETDPGLKPSVSYMLPVPWNHLSLSLYNVILETGIYLATPSQLAKDSRALLHPSAIPQLNAPRVILPSFLSSLPKAADPTPSFGLSKPALAVCTAPPLHPPSGPANHIFNPCAHPRPQICPAPTSLHLSMLDLPFSGLLSLKHSPKSHPVFVVSHGHFASSETSLGRWRRLKVAH